jgi:beta-fructofuranosidase
MDYKWDSGVDTLITAWSFNEGEGRLAWDSAGNRHDEIEYALHIGRFQPPKEPVWREGISGKALSFDGYSTYIRRPVGEVRKPISGLTICAWVAPRSYEYGSENRLAAIANQHCRERAEGYVFGMTRYGAWSLQLGTSGEWNEVWSRERVLPLYEWSFIAATYNGQTMKLYLNGKEAASVEAACGGWITPSEEDLLIGRNNHGFVVAESFIMNHFDGFMDELVIWDRPLDAEEIRRKYEADLRPHNGSRPRLHPEDFIIPRERFTQDRHRPQFHLTPPGHWMNEPHAPIYYNGRYHLFYQFNPAGPFWHYIHWGHWVSEDMVNWRDLPPALYPEAGIDPEGVWSGSAVLDENGFPALFFTAGNNERSPNQFVGMARSTYPDDGDLDLVHWVKSSNPIVILEPEVSRLPEFRDPFVWKQGERWFMLVGSGIEDHGGTAFVYVSEDFKDWTYRGPLYVSNYEKFIHLGTAWELPVLLPLQRDGRDTGKSIFLICPWGPGSKADVTYWIGSFDPIACQFIPDNEEPQLIDVGDNHFTGPSGMIDPVTGRTLLFTIAQGERTPEIDYDAGWAHTAGMPVSLSLREDGRLGIEPIGEMQELRDRKLIELSDVSMEEANSHLRDIQGDMLEILIKFARGGHAKRYGLSVRRSPNGEEETLIFYDQECQQFGVDRTHSTLDRRERPSGVQQGKLELHNEPLVLNIFVDRSLIEAYACGLKSLTTRTYPSREDATGLQLFAHGQLKIETLEIWNMKPAFEVKV